MTCIDFLKSLRSAQACQTYKNLPFNNPKMDNKQFNILQWNCRSINSNKYSLLNYLNTTTVDVIILVETWLKKNQSFHIRDFSCVRNDRDDGYAGVAILISNKYAFSKVELSPNYNNNIMACAVRITKHTSLDIMAIYKPPKIRATFTDWSNILQQCNTKNCFIGGDFNIHNTTWGSTHDDRFSADLINALDEFNLTVLNNGSATHITHTGHGSAIDLSLASCRIAGQSSWEILDDTMGSNHYPIITKFRQNTAITTPVFPSSKWNVKNVDWQMYTQTLETLAQPISEKIDAQGIYDHLLGKINTVADTLFRIRNTRPLNKRLVCWWDSSCDEVITKRKNALRVYKSCPTQENFISYKKISATTKKFLKSKARENWRNFCENLNRETPITKIWKRIKAIKPQCIIKQDIPETILIELLRKLCPDSAETDSEICDCLNCDHVLLAPLTDNELERALKANTNTAPGLDNVLYPMLKHLPREDKKLMLRMFNKIYVEGNNVEELKSGIVVSIVKKDKTIKSSNDLRPISLLSCILKTLERIIKFRLDWWLESRGHLPKHQYGFRRGMGTQHALADLVTDIQTNFTRNNYLLAVFMDLKDAYNNVNLKVLKSKLKEINIPHCLANNIVNLYTNRKLYVRTPSNEIIGPRCTSKGLAQGSVLSPLLFNVYTHDLNIPDVQIIQYADDIVLYSEQRTFEKCIDVLNQAMKKFVTWCDSKELVISWGKCQVQLFSRHRKPSFEQVNLGNTVLPVANVSKYLGMYLDKQLTWRAHINQTVKKCNKANNILRMISKVSFGADIHTSALIYRATVRSILDYGSMLYSSACKTHLKKLDIVDNRAIRLCLGAMNSTPVPALYVEMGEPPLDIRRKLLSEKFVLKTRACGPHHLVAKFARLCQHNLVGTYWMRKTSPSIASAFTTTANFDDQICKTNLSVLYTLPFRTLIHKPMVIFPAFTESIHANKILFAKLINEHKKQLAVFTDGAKNKIGTACAFLVPEKGYNRTFSLPTETSIFTAEAIAITKVLEYAQHLNNKNITVFSDSKSVLLSLKNVNSASSPIIAEILQLDFILKQRGKNIKFIWIKAHSQIHFNEMADQLAKKACHDKNTFRITVPYTDYLNLLKRNEYRNWQQEYTGSYDRRPTNYFLLYPNIQKTRWYDNNNIKKKVISQILRLSFRHGRFPSHLYKIKIINNDKCLICQEERGDIDHLVLGCKKQIRNTNKLIYDLHCMKLQSPLNVNYMLAQNKAEVNLRLYRYMLEANITI